MSMEDDGFICILHSDSDSDLDIDRLIDDNNTTTTTGTIPGQLLTFHDSDNDIKFKKKVQNEVSAEDTDVQIVDISHSIVNKTSNSNKSRSTPADKGSSPDDSETELRDHDVDGVNMVMDDKYSVRREMLDLNKFKNNNESFEDDIQTAMALSLQPQYMPKSNDEYTEFKQKQYGQSSKSESGTQEMKRKLSSESSASNPFKHQKVKHRSGKRHSDQSPITSFGLHNIFKPVNFQKIKQYDSEDEFSDDLPDLDVEITEVVKPKIKAEPDVDNVPSKKFKSSKDSCAKSANPKKYIRDTNLLFTTEHKNKLLKLLSTVPHKDKVLLNKTVRPESPASPEVRPESPRHWMDCLDSLNRSSKIPNESDYQSDTDTCSSLESLRLHKLPAKKAIKKSPLIHHLREIDCESDDSSESNQCNWPVSHSDIVTQTKHEVTQNWLDHNINSYDKPTCDLITNNFVPTISDNSILKLRTVRVAKPVTSEDIQISGQTFPNKHYSSIKQVKFPLSADCDIVESFSAMHINSLEAVLEEGDDFFEYGLNLLKGFIVQKKPTLKIMDSILFKGLLGDFSASICVKCYNVLRFVWQTYPDLIHIDWELLCDKVGGVTHSSSDTTSNLQAGLLLHLYVFGIELDMLKNSLRNRPKLIKTFAFKMLSVDCAIGNLKLIVRWIDVCLNSASIEILNDEMNFRNSESLKKDLTEKQLMNFHTPFNLLPDLNRLLELGIDISRSCLEAAKRIASELKKSYIYLADIQRKKVLLQVICSDLLKFKLVQRVMEDCCDRINPSGPDIPLSFRDLRESYYRALPPKSPIFTPPQSPSDQDPDFEGVSAYSAENVEELSLLIYYLSKSYLNCKKRCLFVPLHDRSSREFNEEDQKELDNLPKHIVDLIQNLRELNPTVNTFTEQNCVMLYCLSEA